MTTRPIQHPIKGTSQSARDIELDDTRRTCTPGIGHGCQHYRPGFCGNPHRAGLTLRNQARADIGRHLATLPQRCPGYAERAA